MIIKTKTSYSNKKATGFTLIEILLVIALIAILATIVFVAINPARRLAEANNAQRWSDAKAILDAVLTYTVDSEGSMPSGIDSLYNSAQMLGTGSDCDSCTATTTLSSCLNLTSDLVGGYIAIIPTDPVVGTAAATGYYINKESSGAVIVGACEPDAVSGVTPTIMVLR